MRETSGREESSAPLSFRYTSTDSRIVALSPVVRHLATLSKSASAIFAISFSQSIVHCRVSVLSRLSSLCLVSSLESPLLSSLVSSSRFVSSCLVSSLLVYPHVLLLSLVFSLLVLSLLVFSLLSPSFSSLTISVPPPLCKSVKGR